MASPPEEEARAIFPNANHSGSDGGGGVTDTWLVVDDRASAC